MKKRINCHSNNAQVIPILSPPHPKKMKRSVGLKCELDIQAVLLEFGENLIRYGIMFPTHGYFRYNNKKTIIYKQGRYLEGKEKK